MKETTQQHMRDIMRVCNNKKQPSSYTAVEPIDKREILDIAHQLLHLWDKCMCT